MTIKSMDGWGSADLTLDLVLKNFCIKVPSPKFILQDLISPFLAFFPQDSLPKALTYQRCLTYRMIHSVLYNLINCCYMLKGTADKGNNAI